MSDQNSGATGRLTDDDIAILEACDISFIRTNVNGKWQKVLTNGAAEAIERIVREHTDRALAEALGDIRARRREFARLGATELDEAAVRRDAQVVREHIPSGYHVAHRVADAVPLLLDEITRLRAALDEAGAEVEWRSRHIEIGAEQLTAMKARAEAAEERAFAEHQRALVAGHEQAQDDLEELVRERDEARAERDSWKVAAERREQRAVAAENAQWAAESALEAVRALVGPANPRSATAGSAYSTGRWDAFAEVRAALDGETEDGVFGDPDIHARLTRAALATPTTPEESQP